MVTLTTLLKSLPPALKTCSRLRKIRSYFPWMLHSLLLLQLVQLALLAALSEALTNFPVYPETGRTWEALEQGHSRPEDILNPILQ